MTLFDRLCAALLVVKRFVNVLLLLISPMALLMLIVAVIMFLDTHGAYRRRVQALEEVPLTAEAAVASCYEDDHYCFAEFTDVRGRERYGKLDWRYYSKEVVAELSTLTRGDVVTVRYASDWYESEVMLAEHYEAFLNYRGYVYEMGGVALVSWAILILHPEVMLFALVDDIGARVDGKWKRMTGLK